MDRFGGPRVGDLVCGVLIVAVAAASAACGRTAPTPQRSAATASLRLSCERRGDALDCRAIGTRDDQRAGSRSEVDLTDAVAWSSSNPQAVGMINGRVTANQPGVATIAASVRTTEETVSSSALVVVTKERPYPQLAYDLTGVVRDPTNSGLTNVELTLTADREPAPATESKTGTVSDGAFHFPSLLSGEYRLRATKEGYRPVERRVTVPNPTPLTVVLISEAR